MCNIKFARVDGRLIHGQVVIKWSNSVGINSIYIVDDPTAKDEFMRDLYLNLQNNYSFKVKVFTVDEVIEYWNQTGFKNDKVMILFKDIEHALRAREAGLPYPILNIGGVPKTKDNKPVTDYAALTDEQFSILEKINDDYDVEVYFQAVPDLAKKALSEVKL